MGLFVYGLLQRTFKGFPILSLGNASLAVGLIFLCFRDVLPDLVTAVITNTLLIVGVVLYLEGIRRFRGTTVLVHPIGLVAILLNLGLFVFYTYQVPSHRSRMRDCRKAYHRN